MVSDENTEQRPARTKPRWWSIVHWTATIVFTVAIFACLFVGIQRQNDSWFMTFQIAMALMFILDGIDEVWFPDTGWSRPVGIMLLVVGPVIITFWIAVHLA